MADYEGMNIDQAIRKLQRKIAGLADSDPKRKLLSEKLRTLLSGRDPFADIPRGGMQAAMESTGRYTTDAEIGSMKRMFERLTGKPGGSPVPTSAAPPKNFPLAKYTGSISQAAKDVGKKASGLGKYAKMGGNILGGLFLANAMRETYRDDRVARSIDAMNPADPRSLLEGLRREELLRARQSRLAQQDPVAMMMLKRLMAGKQMPPKLATGEYMVGQAMEAPDASDEDVQALLASLG